MALIAAPFSNINFLHCSFPILQQCNFSSKRSHSASTLFPVTRSPLLSATWPKKGLIRTSISPAMRTVAIPLLDPILKNELIRLHFLAEQARLYFPVRFRGCTTCENCVRDLLVFLDHVVLVKVSRWGKGEGINL